MGTPKITDEEEKQILTMRRGGASIREISLVVKRSKGTISRYIQGVEVLPEYYAQWLSKRGGNAQRSEARRKEADVKVQNILGNFMLRDQLLVAACLYWGEGNKRDFSFTNSDPKLIETFLMCLKKLGLPKERIKVSIRIYEDIDPQAAKTFWAKITGITPEKIFSVNVLSGKKVGKLPYGMCRIRIARSNDYFNLMTATIRMISNNFALVAQGIEQWTPKP